MWKNLIYAFRGLLKTPTFTLAALLCLALGIGATTAIFSIVNAVILRPLPYKDSGRLVRLYTEFPSQDAGLHKFWFSEPEVFNLQALHSFSAIGAWGIAAANVSGGEQPVRIITAYVNAPGLQTLGVKPELGRLINPDEDKVGVERVIVLSHSLWKSEFGADRNIIGQQIYLNNEKCRVVGVMPANFMFPPGETDPPQAWSSLQLNPLSTSYGSHWLSVFARLRDGVSPAQAKQEIYRLVSGLGQADSANHHMLSAKNHPISLYGFYGEVVGKVRKAMLLLLFAVALVLLIACVNVANLLLARSEARHREIAVRRAIGASGRHLLNQFIIEGILLSFVGAAIGIALAYGALHLIGLTDAGNIPRASEINIDWRVLVFTLATSCITGILFGLAPLVHTSAIKVFDTLKTASTRTVGTVASNRFRRALVIGEMTMAFLLLSGASLMVQGFWRLQQVNPGFNPDKLLTLSVSLPDKTYKDAAACMNFWTRLQADLAQLPGVRSATIMAGLPPIRPVNEDTTDFENSPAMLREHKPDVAYYQVAGDDFFKTLQVPLIEGRFLSPRDGDKNSRGVVINSAAAHTFWPHMQAIGQRLRPHSLKADDPWYTVVGVVGDIKNHGLDQPADTEVFFPYRMPPFNNGLLNAPHIVLRTQGDPLSFAAAVRRAVNEVDPSLPVAKVSTMENVIADANSRPRFLTLVMGLFSLIALGLAAIGIYGVISYSVEQRTAEFGIKMALGAQPTLLLRQVIGQGLLLACIGIIIGIFAASFLTQALQGIVFGIGSQDYFSLLITGVVLAAATVLACAIPAVRAMRLDPVTALRYE
jgi:putative ABC transport system permease protein